ncbi:hypothetical protein GJU41_12040 [Bacillus idriensis]|uniref:Uncharacterized protein n=1 Tax=Metabacillus idriensis TaxID=324768 RepID=A0A6I2MBH3_9BACI|nr:hypothetical protein [Metabacillus idriensis]MRX54704.1 hypothetical protein [Metabacillus idriensis]
MVEFNWTEESVISKIKDIYGTEKIRNIGNISKEEKNLYRAGLRIFGTWEDAVKTAGFNHEDFLKRKKWTEYRVSNEIKRIYGSGEIFEIKNLQKKYPGLYNAGRRIYGSWDEAISAAGYNPDHYNKFTKWSKEVMISELKRTYEEHEDLSTTFLAEINKTSIPVMAKKLFGSYQNALTAAGFNPNEIQRKKSIWSEQEIKEKLLEAYEREGTLSQKVFRAKYKKLVGISHRKYNGWFNMLKHFGLSTDEVKTQWRDDEQILEEILLLKNSGTILSHAHVPNSIYLAASRRFGSWDEALESAGLSPDDERINISWTKRKMIARIQGYSEQGYNISQSSIFSIDSALASSYIMYYRKWDGLLKDAGVFTLTNTNDMDKTKMGYHFQKIMREILEAIGLNFKYETYRGQYRPDFSLNESTVMDAKLSSWTALSDGTLRKYNEICDKLIIFYLRGNEIKGNDFVTFIPVEDFFDALKSRERTDLIECVENLKEKLSELESGAS